MLNNSNKLPFFGFGTSNGRDDNHNDKSNTSYYTKDSSIAALEAFQRDYLPSASSASGQRLAPVSLSSLAPMPLDRLTGLEWKLLEPSEVNRFSSKPFL